MALFGDVDTGGGIGIKFQMAANGDSSTGTAVGGVTPIGKRWTGIAGICEGGNTVPNQSGLVFYTYDGVGNASPAERMRIDGYGNVGIGTTVPDKYYLNSSETGGSWPSSEGLLTIHGGASGTEYGIARMVLQCNANHTASVFAQHTGYGNTYLGFTTTAGTAAPLERMRIDKDGNVGIGTTAPNYALSFGQSHDGDAVWNAGKGIIACYEETSTGKYFYGMGIGSSGSSPNSTGGLCLWGGTGGSVPSNSNCHLFIKRDDGRVGIGTTSPWTGLHVEASHGGNYHQAYNSFLWETGYTYDLWTSGNHRPQHSDSYSYFSIYSNRAILIRNGGIWSASDKRIKMNIEDVPDNISLEMLRNIPCRYYQYKDPTRQNGNKKTIGFIAQEVDEIFPIAITKKEDLIPSEMRLLVENENAIWTDLSDNTCKLYITDLEDAIPNTECLFILSDSSYNIIEKKIQVLDDGKSFIFKKKWNKVFLHSKMVSDFHVVDKQKLFALNFSATQELDRKVIALENKIATLESELSAIKQHLGL